MANWYFFTQAHGKESAWEMALSSDRPKILAKGPAFHTVLDLSLVPEDNDWTRVKYRGPLYFDFDADGDLELVCDRFTGFLAKVEKELEFDLTQARFYCSGSKGFHIEIPQECFIPKPPKDGLPWLPYIYREVAQSIYVDTLDLKVYTGKRGRMWRTPNVKRENGMYKVPITFGEALSITPDLYRELIAAPREVDPPTPPMVNSRFSLLFDRSKDKTLAHMRHKKKRQEQSNEILEPWKQAKKHPPSIERIMRGEDLNDKAGFQAIAMQLAIYATSVGMSLDELLDKTTPLCETHISDSSRYNTPAKRREELERMFRYMEENTLYDFEVKPIVGLLKRGTPVTDLGIIATEDHDDKPAESAPTPTTGAPAKVEPGDAIDLHKGVRRGFFMNGDGMFRRNGDNTESLCRATLRKVEALVDLETHAFGGYEADLVVNEQTIKRVALGPEHFVSALKLRGFMATHQLSYQGGEADTAALLDIMAEKARRSGRVFTYPREGLFVISNPLRKGEMVKCYLTQDTFVSSLPEDDEGYFRLRYKPANAVSSYNIDIHDAPDLDESMAHYIDDLLSMNRDDVLADMIGWFTAAHYRSIYLRLFSQFPILHIWGQSGAGKTKTVQIMAAMHWWDKDKRSLKSATSSTNFALDVDCSTSTSCPLIIDEWKPKELRAFKGRYEKLKDVLKASYVGSDIGNRGHVNKGAESSLGVIKSKATAPIVYMAEAIETETALFERSITVPLSKALYEGFPERQKAHGRLLNDALGLSAVGKRIVEMGLTIEIDKFRDEVNEIKSEIEARLSKSEDASTNKMAKRLVYNRAVQVHGCLIFKRALNTCFGSKYDERMDELIRARSGALVGEEGEITRAQGMAEISKIINAFAQLSRVRNETWSLDAKDYVVGDGWVEIKVASCYMKYRRYCASVHDKPMFDSLEALSYALNTYSAVIDLTCANSELREEGSDEKIVRLNINELRSEGVQLFRT